VATEQIAVTLEHKQIVQLAATGTTLAYVGADTANGLDVDVTRLPALVAGSANIGDVDVLTVPAPLSTTGGGTEATALRVTIASDSTGLVSVDDNAGSLTVDGTVTANAGTGNFNVVGTKSSNGGAPGATNLGTLPAVANAAAPTHTEANQVALRTNLAGDVAITLDSEAVVLGAGAATIGALTANQSINVAQIAGTTTAVNNGVVGAGVQRVTIASDSTGQVALAAGTTTAVTQATAANLNAQVVGDVAHDGVDAGNPVKAGGRAIAHGAAPTAVAAADRTNWYFNRHGIPFVLGGHMSTFSKESVFTTAQTDVALETIGASNKIVITRASITLDVDTTVTVSYRLGFGATTLPATGTGVAGIVSSHPGLAAGSGQTEGNGGGILAIGADGEDLRFTCDVPTTGAIRVVVSGFIIES